MINKHVHCIFACLSDKIFSFPPFFCLRLKVLLFPFLCLKIMALALLYEDGCDSTFELNENLLTDNEQLSDGSFEDEEAENKELLYPVAPNMVFVDWKKL